MTKKEKGVLRKVDKIIDLMMVVFGAQFASYGLMSLLQTQLSDAEVKKFALLTGIGAVMIVSISIFRAVEAVVKEAEQKRRAR